jgi:hypothetical protein
MVLIWRGTVHGSAFVGNGAESMTAETQKAECESTWLTLSVVCLVMSVIANRLSQTVADPDLWGHVKFGRDIWESGQIIQQDTYSYLTGDQAWINHEWLAEVIFALLFGLGGAEALILFKTGMGVLTVGLLYWNLRRQGLSALRGGIVVMVVTALLSVGMFTIRPQVFTYLLFVVTLLLLNAADGGSLRWLWGIPLVFAVWPNLHGGFLAGMGMVTVWCVARIAASLYRASYRDSSIRRSDAAFVASALAGSVATLVNPYGASLLTFLVRPETINRPEITEWQATAMASKYGFIYLLFLGMAVAGLLFSARQRRPAALAGFFCVAILPLLAIRHGPLFALGIPILAGEHISDAWNRWSARARSGSRRRWEAWAQPWLSGLAITGAAVFLWLSLLNFGCIRVHPQAGGTYPARAVAILRESRVSGNLAIFFNWGEYAIWHLSPRIKVSVDGRRETVYSEQIMTENLNFFGGVGDWDRLLQDHHTQMALVVKTYPVFNLLKLSPGWVLVYEDSLSGIYAREGLPLIREIRAANSPPLPDDGVGLCFP